MSNPILEPTPHLTPEGVIAQLRTMQAQIEEVTPLTQAQRRQVTQRLRRQAKHVVEASINVIGVLDNVSQAIGQPLDEVRRLQDDSLRWEAAADEARAFLKGIEGANLVRRQRLDLIATQAYSIGAQLAKDPGKAVLDVFFVSEVVIAEIAGGDPNGANDRLQITQRLPLLSVTEEAERLAPLLLKAGALAANAATDALHMALAAVHGMDYLLSWNCTHIANATIRRAIERQCRSSGYEPPVICTPQELAKG